MTKFKATCSGCAKRYRVRTQDKIYACTGCGGDVVAKGPSASRRRKEPGLIARILGRISGGGGGDCDAVDPADTIDSMDWDVFGAPPLEAEIEPESDGNRGGSWRRTEESPAPPMPRTPPAETTKPAPSGETTASAFDGFGWD